MIKIYAFLIVFFVININSISQNAYIVVDKYDRTQDNKLLLQFHVENGRSTDLYKLNVHLYINQQEQKIFSVSGDFKNINGSIYSGKFYWDVLKDIAEFPKISDVYVVIDIVDIISNKINATSDILKNDSKKTVFSNSEKSVNEFSNPKILNNRIERSNDRKKANSDGYFSVAAFEYDYIDKSFQVDFFRMGFSGFVWVLGSISSSKDQNENSIIIPTIGTKAEFKIGGPIFKGLDICLVGTAHLASNSSMAEDKDDERNNEDIYEKINYFGGIELSTNFQPNAGSILNFYIKAGFDSKKLGFKYVQSDYSYSNKVIIGPTQYFTVTFGANIVNFSKDILRLW